MIDQSSSPRFEDLEDKGFLTIPSFLSVDDIQFLLNDFGGHGPAENTNIRVVPVQDEAIAHLRDKIQGVISHVTGSTSIHVDVDALHLGYYFASELVSLKLHQDHESFYAVQNLSDYLNFFIPIQKPVREKGNLRIIPWDSLKARCPKVYEKLIQRGGTSYEVVADRTLIIGDEGMIAELPFDIDTISVTPELGAGDLLLMRGNVIHGTQDVDTKRIALSVRFTNPDTQVSRRRLLSGGSRKTVMMQSNWSYFGPIVRAFQVTGSKSMSWRQLANVIKNEGVAGCGTDSRRVVVRAKLLMQRLATGAVFPSVGRRFGFLRARMYASRLERAQLSSLEAALQQTNQH